MFPLVAIAAFFILGIAFFAIGKDDFGIKRVKEVPNDTPSKDKEILNTEPELKNEFTEEKEIVSSETSSEVEATGKATD
tara:strand:- start:331 stop:567 length:237 start_codon:yes stop_codon:yes gene_type:complete